MEILFTLLGGLGLFLYGMDAISKGLQAAAGNRLKGLLRTLTCNRYVGVLSGFFTTTIVQSSSVTTVMVVGFVNAGLMALPQAISVILGAHIGTTITAQIIAFRVQNFALPIIAFGAILHLLGRHERVKSIGEAIFGFGIIFLGLSLMGIAFNPLRDNGTFQHFLQVFSIHPLLGFLAGLLITVLVQSSTVTTGITIALALSSAISFGEAVPLILGENVGTTITANLAAIGGSHTAKQAARAHFITSALGAVIIFIFLKPFMQAVLFFSPAYDTARQIANSHTLFNVFTTIIFLPFISVVAQLTDFLIIKDKRKKEELYYLEKTSLQDPGTALDQVKLALMEMNGFVSQVLKYLTAAVNTLSDKNLEEIHQLTQKVIRYRSRVTEYLGKIAAKNLASDESKRIPKYVRILHEIERVRDYEEKIKEVVIALQSEGRNFHPIEKKELKSFFKDAINILNQTNIALSSADKRICEKIMAMYEAIDVQKNQLIAAAKERYVAHRTEIATANYYYDVATALEEIAKKCRNIAAAMLE